MFESLWKEIVSYGGPPERDPRAELDSWLIERYADLSDMSDAFIRSVVHDSLKDVAQKLRDRIVELDRVKKHRQLRDGLSR